LYIMFRLRYFTIVCNANEYKMMGQGASLGQLYDVKNEIPKKQWLGLCIYYAMCVYVFHQNNENKVNLKRSLYFIIKMPNQKYRLREVL
jgi:hypothetical protein